MGALGTVCSDRIKVLCVFSNELYVVYVIDLFATTGINIFLCAFKFKPLLYQPYQRNYMTHNFDDYFWILGQLAGSLMKF